VLLNVDILICIKYFSGGQASLAWSDTTYEKCWHGWLSFKNEEKRKRSERMLKYQQLAGKIVQLNFLWRFVSQPKIDQ